MKTLNLLRVPRSAIAVGMLLVSGLALAERPKMSPEELNEKASYIIEGKVAAIYQKVSEGTRYRDTAYVAEVKVDTVTKGDLKPGELVYVRYWTRRFIGKGLPEPGASGHWEIPKEGESVRLFLARNSYNGFGKSEDGGLDVLGPNGFQKLDSK